MRLIDADKIITDEDLIDFLLDRYKETNNHMFLTAANSIDLYRRDFNLMNFCLEYQNKWISVTEQLPTWKDGKVLIYTPYGISIAQKTTTNHWKGENAIPKLITHWMSLPEPPTDKEN